MNFDYNYPYIGYDSDDLPYELYDIYGLSKINELSRQLQTFLNFKQAIIHYRFRPENMNHSIKKDKKYKELKSDFKSLVSKFIKLLLEIKGNGSSYELEIKKLLIPEILNNDRRKKKILLNLKDITEKLFAKIHFLSDLDPHIHPKLVKFITNIIQTVIKVLKNFNNWALEYYEELRLNYSNLHNEICLLISDEQSERNEKNTVKKQRTLKEGLKEW